MKLAKERLKLTKNPKQVIPKIKLMGNNNKVLKGILQASDPQGSLIFNITVIFLTFYNCMMFSYLYLCY